MAKLAIVGFVTIFSSLPLLAKTSLPPIQGRIYVKDTADPYAPIKILPLNNIKEGGFVRDPSMERSKKPIAAAVRAERKPIVQPKKLAYKPKSLRFKPMVVQGRISKPRVSFKRSLLPLRRVDEPRRPDFLRRVYADGDQDL